MWWAGSEGVGDSWNISESIRDGREDGTGIAKGRTRSL